MLNHPTLLVLTNKSAADSLRPLINADVLHIDSVPWYGSKRRYEKIFFQYPDEAWMLMRGFHGSEEDGFLVKYVGEANLWLTRTGSISYL